MNKVTKSVAVIAAISVLAAQSTYAAPLSASTAALNVSAVVAQVLAISATIRQNSSTGTVLPAIAYGTLQQFNDINGVPQTLRSSALGSTGTGDGVIMVTVISTLGTQYTVTEVGTAMTSGANTIPAGACAVNPVMNPLDNNGSANVGVLAAAGSWIGSRTVYTSDAIGSLRTFQLHHALTDDPVAGASSAVPLSQPAGNYNGTITLTVTA